MNQIIELTGWKKFKTVKQDKSWYYNNNLCFIEWNLEKMSENKTIITVFIGSNPLSPNKEMRSYVINNEFLKSWLKIERMILFGIFPTSPDFALALVKLAQS